MKLLNLFLIGVLIGLIFVCYQQQQQLNSLNDFKEKSLKDIGFLINQAVEEGNRDIDHLTRIKALEQEIFELSYDCEIIKSNQ